MTGPVTSDASHPRLHEVGVAVTDLGAAVRTFERALGVTAQELETLSVPGVEMRYQAISLGGQRINLMESLNSEGPVARAVQRRGEGVFNILIEVRDLDEAMARFQEAGVAFVEPEPRIVYDGVHAGRAYTRHRFAWTVPSTFHGVLAELQDYTWRE